MTAKSLGNIARPMAALIAIAVVITVGLDRGARFLSQPPVLAANAAPKGAETATTRVDVMKPHQGGLPRISVQPGSIHAFEAAEIYKEPRYADSGKRGGDFLILAQMPDPRDPRGVRHTLASLLLAAVGGAGGGALVHRNW